MVAGNEKELEELAFLAFSESEVTTRVGLITHPEVVNTRFCTDFTRDTMVALNPT